MSLNYPRFLAAVLLVLPLSFLAVQENGAGDVAEILDRPVDVNLRGAHLQDLITDLREHHNIELALDRRALEDAGVETNKAKSLEAHASELRQVAFNLRRRLKQLNLRLPPDHELFARAQQLEFPGTDFAAQGIPLRDALHHALAAWNASLTFDLRGDQIVVTTLEEEENSLITRVYDVRRLIRVPAGARENLLDPIGDIAGGQYDYDTLIDLLTLVVEPNSWDEAGGSGSVAAGNGTLTIAQTHRNHELIRALFAKLDSLHEEREQDTPDTTPVWIYHSEATARQTRSVLDVLDAEKSLCFQEVPLATVIASLRQDLHIPIRIDYRALDDVDVSVWSPVTFDATEVSVKSSLESLLEEVDPSLTFIVDHGVLLITTREVEEEQLLLRLYPVWDLVRDNGEESTSGSGDWDYDSLINNITSSVAPESWEDVGGPSSVAVEPIVGVLAFQQTRRIHQQVQDLIDEFRRVAAQQRAEKPAEGDVSKSEYLTVVFRLWQPYSEKAIVQEDAVVKLLSEMIEPESWDAEEVFVRTLPSRLIIRQKKSVHRQIYQTLQNLAILKPLSETSPAHGADVGFGGMGGFGGSAAAGALPPGTP